VLGNGNFILKVKVLLCADIKSFVVILNVTFSLFLKSILIVFVGRTGFFGLGGTPFLELIYIGYKDPEIVGGFFFSINNGGLGVEGGPKV
jgi:hypothetical protein